MKIAILKNFNSPYSYEYDMSCKKWWQIQILWLFLCTPDRQSWNCWAMFICSSYNNVNFNNNSWFWKFDSIVWRSEKRCTKLRNRILLYRQKTKIFSTLNFNILYLRQFWFFWATVFCKLFLRMSSIPFAISHFSFFQLLVPFLRKRKFPQST